MDDKTAAKEFAALTDELAIGYAIITGILARLPIPMRLPDDQAAEPEWAVHAMSRAWELADEQPLRKLHTGRIRDMITSWLTAYELAVAVSAAGPGAWRLRGMEAALLRVRTCAYYIDRRLTGFGR
jgi:hypothetical protein